jgi:hypothetical protein
MTGVKECVYRRLISHHSYLTTNAVLATITLFSSCPLTLLSSLLTSHPPFLLTAHPIFLFPSSPLILPPCHLTTPAHHIQVGESREISDDEIYERCYYSMVNGALALLFNGTAQSADDVDAVFTRMYGYKTSLGGLL